MSNVNVKMSFECMMSPEEFRLVCKGLSGRLTDEDRVPAVELANRLATQRAGGVKSALNSNEKLMKGINENPPTVHAAIPTDARAKCPANLHDWFYVRGAQAVSEGDERSCRKCPVVQVRKGQIWEFADDDSDDEE